MWWTRIRLCWINTLENSLLDGECVTENGASSNPEGAGDLFLIWKVLHNFGKCDTMKPATFDNLQKSFALWQRIFHWREEAQMTAFQDFQRQITEFVFAEDTPQKSDIIFIPGNGYPQMAEHAAQLWRLGYAPYVLPSGRYSVTLGHFAGVLEKKEKYSEDYETEWEFLCHVLMENGVPKEAILREDQATFTYENAICSRQVTDRSGLEIQRGIICCKGHHARRCLMYYQTQFPEARLFVCPSAAEGINRDNWYQTEAGIDEVMGEVSRITKQFNLMMK